MKKKIVVLGAKGMLGQMVVYYFQSMGYDVGLVSERFNESSYEIFLLNMQTLKDVILINAIGKIPQKSTDTNQLLWSNATLPLALSQHLDPSVTLVHPSTDCVFTGKNGPYSISSIPDAMDAYGWSKRLGEIAVERRKNTLILRVSIIGPDASTNGRGLLGWFLNEPKHSQLNGYTDHLWNGITTLEWCKQCEKILFDFKPTDTKMEQLGTKNHLSKYEMLNLFKVTYNHEVDIQPVDTGKAVDKRLIPTKESPSLETQLQELKSFRWKK